MECKSGYGLDTENEIKMLKVIEKARSDPDVQVEISSTFCGAHAVPRSDINVFGIFNPMFAPPMAGV